MALKIFLILLTLISYVYCIEFNFTNVPEKFIPGESLNIGFNLLDNVNQTEYTINFSLCQLNNCNNAGVWKTFNEINNYNISTIFNNDICYFYDKPTNDWLIRAEIIISDDEKLYFDSEKLDRELICEDKRCIEKACTNPNNNNNNNNNSPKVIPVDAEIDKQLHTPNDPNSETEKKISILVIIFVIFTLFIILVAISISIYLKSFKKKEEDPIPIFSVEDSSYCYEPSLSMDKSLINAGKISSNDQQKIPYNNSPKAVNQIGLSVQLQRINPINDYNSQISQNSNRSRITNNTYRIKQDNYNNEVKSELSEHSNFGSPPISPISISSSIPVVSVQKINKRKSLKSDININKNQKNYYNPPSPSVCTESPTVVEIKPKVADKHFNHAKYEKESAKVLSSKHYVLSTFEGDYDKEELNLHYGDIVSVINILPDGWAYGELLMNYNSYDSNYNNDKVKLNTKGKQRKFGYYPIKCLSLNEDTDETIPEPSKNMKKIKHHDLKQIDIPTDDSNSYNYNDGKDMYEREKATLLYPVSPLGKNSTNINDNNNNNNNNNNDNGESVNSSKSNIININKNDNSNNSINNNNNNKSNINNNITNDNNNKNDKNDNHKDNNNHKNNDHNKEKNNNKSNDKHKDNDNHKNDSDKNSDNNKKKLIRIHKRSASNTINTRTSKRSSIFNLFKRASRDFSMTSKEVIHIYSEPNSSHKKQNSVESIFDDSDSSTETIYHDARGEEAIVEIENSNSPYNKSYNLNRLSVRSFISYRSY